MKINIICLLLLLIVYLPDISSAQDRFGPWDPDVSIGDDNFSGKNVNISKLINVSGGPQAGAYLMIRFFQVFISPQDGPNCRFSPTCSSYGRMAVLKYGAVLGSFLAGDRIIRCNPFNEPGEDSVPESIFINKMTKSRPLTVK